MVLHLLIPLALVLGLASEPDVSADYLISITNPESRIVDVRAEFTGLTPDHDPFHMGMADQYSFVRLDEPLFEGEIEAADPAGKPLSLERTSPYSWKVDTRGNNSIVLNYRVPLRHGELPIVMERNDVYEQPFLDDQCGMLVSGTLIIGPRDMCIKEAKVSFSVPEGWGVLCPWEALGDNTYKPTVEEAMNDLIAVGHWSRHTIEVDGMTITIAFTPGQNKLEEAAIPIIEKIARAELALFEEIPESKYIFLFARPIEHGFGGSPKTGSMVLAVDSRFEKFSEHFPIQSLLGHLVAHEFFHLWGGQKYQCPDELRFFNEGFTDYYAYLVLAREGILKKEEFLDKLCECMKVVADNELRKEMSLVEAGGEPFFTDRRAGSLIYQGGLIAAALLDARIRAKGAGESLDHFMRKFNNDSRWVYGEAAPAMDDFLLCVEAYVGEASMQHFAELVEKPFDLDPVREFGLAGIQVEPAASKSRPDLRGNLDAKTGTTLLDLDPTGLAYALGIRPDDRFIEINGKKPKTRGDVYSAWSNPQNGRVRVTYERDGKTIEVDEALPVEMIYTFASPDGLFGL